MAFENLTPDEHQQIIYNMSAERTAVVKGVAGSGKSLCLLWKARQVSTLTTSYAIIVYTKSLKQFFVDELAVIDPTGKHVYYFDEWKKSPKPSYKYLFVDECQDFNAEEIADFRAHGEYCWFFGDTNQSIMAFEPTIFNLGHTVQSVEDTANQIGVHPQDLCINHRLTIENSKVGESIYPQTRLSFACIKHGPKPRLINTVANQVTSIRDYFLSKGIPVQWKTYDDMDIDFKSTSPKIITWHCAKGLQFNDVFIPCCGLNEYRQYVGWNRDPMTEKIPDLYVATTRTF